MATAAARCIDETRPVAPATARAQRRVDAEALLALVRPPQRRDGDASCAFPASTRWTAPAATRANGVRRGTPVLARADDVYTNHIHADDLARACVAALYRGRAAARAARQRRHAS